MGLGLQTVDRINTEMNIQKFNITTSLTKIKRCHVLEVDTVKILSTCSKCWVWLAVYLNNNEDGNKQSTGH